MEKLLLITKKQGGKNAGTITGQRKKTLAIALEATANVFCQRTGKQPKRQPIAGCIILVNL
jgi:hypothetical protein